MPAPRSRPPVRTVAAALAVPGLLLGLAACGTVRVPAGPEAADPACADVVVGAPPELLGLERHETSSQGTVAWGSGEDTVVLRCGVTPPGPTTERCTRLGTEGELTIDWIVREQDGVVFYTTYGRLPAIEVSVPRSVAPDQPSAAALDLAQLVSTSVEATAYCVGAGDVE